MEQKLYLVIQVDVSGMTDHQISELRYAMTVQVEDTPAEGRSANDSTIVLEPVLK